MIPHSLLARVPRVALATALLSPFAAAAGDLAAILEHARASLGVSSLAPGTVLVAEGDARFLGTEGRARLVFDGRGRFRSQIEGPLGQTIGFDGEDAWEIDMAGSQRVLELADRGRELLLAWTITGQWIARADELGLAPLEGEGEAAVQPESLRLALSLDELDGTLDLDARSHRPRTLTLRVAGTSVRTSFADFQEFEGLVLPTRIETESGPIVTRSTIARVAASTERATDPFERPAPRVRDARFVPEAAPALEVVRAPTGHLLVSARVDGRDVGKFLFDTGAGINCISERAAAELGLEPFGEILAVGVGGKLTSPFHRAGSIDLGPVTLVEPLLMGLDLDFLEPHMGAPIAGILGYNLLTRVVAEIDLAEGRVALFDPASYGRDDLEWEHLVLYRRHPCVRARFEGHAGLFRLDTGAAQDTVTFHSPAVRRLELLAGRETRPAAMGGVGGLSEGRSGVLTDFVLAGHRFEAPRASFALGDVGAFAEPSTLGNIGGRFLAPFVLVTDYPGRRIAFLRRD